MMSKSAKILLFCGKVAAMGMASVQDDGTGDPLKLYGFAMTPESEMDPEAGPDQRLHHRAQSLMQDYSADLAGSGEGTEDVDVEVGG